MGLCWCFFFFKQKTAYWVRISDWISDVCSSDLRPCRGPARRPRYPGQQRGCAVQFGAWRHCDRECRRIRSRDGDQRARNIPDGAGCRAGDAARSEEHTSELQSLMRISYAVFCLKKKRILYVQNNHYSTQRSMSNAL